MSDLVKMEEARMKVTRGANVIDDAILMMEPYNNWEEKILPAPFAIAVLGQLVIISNSVDFPMKAPKDGFKFVQWPDSFRASLAQVTGEGYKAFNTAHQCMDEIRLSTNHVPGHLSSAIKILIGGTDQDVEHMLPITLRKIEDIVGTCKKRSEEVELKFKSVMDLVLELQQACVATHSASETQLERIQNLIKVQNMKENDLKEQKARYRKQYAHVKKEVKRSSKRYDEALDEIPNAAEILGLTVLESITNTVQSLSSILGFGKKLCSGDFSFITELTNNANYTNSNLPQQRQYVSYGDIQLYMIGKGLSAPVNIFQKYFDGEGDLIEISAADEDSTFGFQELFFKHQKDMIRNEHGNPTLKNEITKICTDSLQLCQDIKKRVRSGDVGPAATLHERVQEISDATNQLHMRCCQALLTDPMQGATPNMSKRSTYNTSGSVTQQRIKNAHFNVEASTERLQLVEKQFEKVAEDMRKNNKEMSNALAEMASFEAEEASHKDIIDMLQEGIEKFGILQEKWAQLSLFFEHIATLIETSLTVQLTTFVEYTRSTRQLQLETGVKMSEVTRDTIYQTVFEAAKYSSLVNHLATGYWQISDKYLMKSVSRLGQLLALRDDAHKRKEQMALIESCKETQSAIKEHMKEHNAEFKHKINKRMEMFKNEYKPVIPALSESEMLKVRKLAQDAVNKAPLRPIASLQPIAHPSATARPTVTDAELDQWGG